MNLNQIVNMTQRIIMRKIINKGINAGMGQVGRLGRGQGGGANAGDQQSRNEGSTPSADEDRALNDWLNGPGDNQRNG